MRSGPVGSKELYALQHGIVPPVDRRREVVTPRVRWVFKHLQVAGIRTVLVTLCDSRSDASVAAMNVPREHSSSMPAMSPRWHVGKSAGRSMYRRARAVHIIKTREVAYWSRANKTMQTVVKMRRRCSVLHTFR
jgi:hypothetical protein